MPDVKLLDCPFCASNDVSVHEYYTGDSYMVLCHSCSAEGPLHDTREVAAEYWNRRTPPAVGADGLPDGALINEGTIDTTQFRDMLYRYRKAPTVEQCLEECAKVIAHIDAYAARRAASTAPAPKAWVDRMADYYSGDGSKQMRGSDFFKDQEIADWRARAASTDAVAVPEVLQQALDIALDLAMAEADNVHKTYAGYKPHKHEEVDRDVETIKRAIDAINPAAAPIHPPQDGS